MWWHGVARPAVGVNLRASSSEVNFQAPPARGPGEHQASLPERGPAVCVKF